MMDISFWILWDEFIQLAVLVAFAMELDIKGHAGKMSLGGVLGQKIALN
jgi:hypothetical protein